MSAILSLHQDNMPELHNHHLLDDDGRGEGDARRNDFVVAV